MIRENQMDPPILTMRSVNNEKTEPEQARKQKKVDVEMDPPILNIGGSIKSMNNEKHFQAKNESQFSSINVITEKK